MLGTTATLSEGIMMSRMNTLADIVRWGFEARRTQTWRNRARRSWGLKTCLNEDGYAFLLPTRNPKDDNEAR